MVTLVFTVAGILASAVLVWLLFSAEGFSAAPVYAPWYAVLATIAVVMALQSGFGAWAWWAGRPRLALLLAWLPWLVLLAFVPLTMLRVFISGGFR